MRKRRGASTAFAFTATLALFFFDASPVSAAHAGSYKTGTNSTVAFGQHSLTDRVHNAFHWNDTNNVEPTDVTTALYHDTYTEFNIFDARYGDTGWLGRWYCGMWNADNTICYDSIVQINLSYSMTRTTRRHVMCQEVGHGLGLRHSTASDSCMNNKKLSTVYFNSHDKNVINGKY